MSNRPQRRIFVGDVQGCREELERLLETLRFDPAADELHPAGDLVNRGPDSVGVLRLARELDAGGVLGNHDLHALRTAHGTRKLGRRDTLDELLAADDREELLAWLAARPFVRTWPDVVLVHAAVHPDWTDFEDELAGIDPLTADARSDFATRVRYCDEHGARPEADWPEPKTPFVPWFWHWQKRAGETRTAVFGHWARMGLVRATRVRGLDTGCVWGQELTAWIAEEDRFVSVPAARVYSPTSLPD
ncbi:MAG: diadenosine tetraphosphatase [bacterium]|nr:diadenosine tetraphosphatase [bacterium]